MDNCKPSMIPSSGEAGSGTSWEINRPPYFDLSETYGSGKGDILTFSKERWRELDEPYYDFRRQGDWSQAAQERLKKKWLLTAERFHIILNADEFDRLFENYEMMFSTLSAFKDEDANSMPTSGTNSPKSNLGRRRNPQVNPVMPIVRIKDWNKLHDRIMEAHTLMKLVKFIKYIKGLDKRTILWFLASGAVLGGCLAGRVLTGGTAAPLFILFLAVVKYAKKDLDKHLAAAE